ncbi:type IV pilus modification PilV family protein [Desulfurobacterium sp.]
MKRKGFTIVEALVAMAIFAIAILGIGMLIIFNIKYAQINQKREAALYKANKVLENLASLNYTSTCLTIGTDKTCNNDPDNCCDGFTGDSNIEWKVTSGPDPNTKEITVTCRFSYQNYNGNVTLQYIKGNWQ